LDSASLPFWNENWGSIFFGIIWSKGDAQKTPAHAPNEEFELRGDGAAMDRLILLYFAVVEKGLVRQAGGAKAIGASVISGSGELLHAMAHPEKHLPLELRLVLEHGSTDEEGFMEHFFVGESVDGMADLVREWIEAL